MAQSAKTTIPANHHGGMGLNHSKIHGELYIYANLPRNAIVRLPHPRSGGILSQRTFLAPPADKQTRIYDIEC